MEQIIAELKELSGCDDLNQVETLVINDEASQELQYNIHIVGQLLPNLKNLTVENVSLSSPRDLGSGFKNVIQLTLSSCQLEHIDGIGMFKQVKELRVCNNNIRDPGPCKSLPNLELLDMKNNDNVDLECLRALRLNKNLRCLVIFKNSVPMDPSHELDSSNQDMSGFKREILETLPQLQVLNGHQVIQAPLREQILKKEPPLADAAQPKEELPIRPMSSKSFVHAQRMPKPSDQQRRSRRTTEIKRKNADLCSKLCAELNIVLDNVISVEDTLSLSKMTNVEFIHGEALTRSYENDQKTLQNELKKWRSQKTRIKTSKSKSTLPSLKETNSSCRVSSFDDSDYQSAASQTDVSDMESVLQFTGTRRKSSSAKFQKKSWPNL